MWCAVDLRDGNQALIDPMSPARKRRMFELLVKMGYKEIEVGFPSASQTDYDFVREIIEQGAIPDDVTIQVLTQCRPELIDPDLRSLQRCSERHRALLQLDLDPAAPRGVSRRPRRDQEDRHDGPATARRKRPRIRAPDGATSTGRILHGHQTGIRKEVCDAVARLSSPTPDWPLIVNLPATVEWRPRTLRGLDPVDQPEFESPRLDHSVVAPAHDRGNAVAAAELGYEAVPTASRAACWETVRARATCLVTLGLNLFPAAWTRRSTSPTLTRFGAPWSPATSGRTRRYPYGGDLVYTAFSAAIRTRSTRVWTP